MTELYFANYYQSKNHKQHYKIKRLMYKSKENVESKQQKSPKIPWILAQWKHCKSKLCIQTWYFEQWNQHTDISRGRSYHKQLVNQWGSGSYLLPSDVTTARSTFAASSCSALKSFIWSSIAWTSSRPGDFLWQLNETCKVRTWYWNTEVGWARVIVFLAFS